MIKITLLNVWFVRFLATMGMVSRLAEVKGSPALVPQKFVWTNMGDTVEIFCSATTIQPLNSCVWAKEKNGSRELFVKINAQNELTEAPSEGHYEFAHKTGNIGLEEGHCGLRITNISSLQIGLWGCTLVSNGGDDGPWIGSVDVPLIEKPSKPFIKENEISELIDFGNGTTTKTGNVICCVTEGKPEEGIAFEIYFDKTRIPDSSLHLIGYNTAGNVTVRTSLCIQWDTHLSADDDGKEFVCNVTHQGYSNNDDRSANTLLHVQGPPKFILPKQTNNSTTGICASFTETNELILHFVLRSNPQGDIKISRTLVHTGETSQEAKSEEYLQTNEYILTQNVDNNFVRIDKEHQGNGTEYIYFVTVTNRHGTVKSSVAVVSPPEGSDPQETLWTLIIIGVVMTVVFVLIIVAVLYSTAKRRGWWCYRNITQKYPIARRSAKPSSNLPTGVICQDSLPSTRSSFETSGLGNEYSVISNKEDAVNA